MNASNGTKMEPLLSFPHNAFLMLRLEYVQILQDDLQAKLLRIIESHIETQRQVIYRDEMNKQKGDPKHPIKVPKDIFVPISYKLFMNDLFDLVTSENTIKKSLNQMIEYKIIFRKEPPKKRYAPPEYSINTDALQILLDALKDQWYQKLIPSILDTLKNSYPQDLTPSWYQKLIPSNSDSSLKEKSMVSKVDTNIRENNITDKKDSTPTLSSPDNASSFAPSLAQSSSVSPQESTAPSSAPTLSTELPTGVDNEQAVTSTDASLIANESTSNRPEKAAPAQVESMTTRNTSNEANTGINNDLDPEQQRIASYLEELEFDFDLTPLNKQHLTKLAKRVKSVEQMKSLKAFTENQELLKGKTIYLGNLANANNLNGWRQSEQAKQRAEAQKSAPINPSKLTSVSGMRNYSAEPEVQPTIQKSPQDGLVQIPKFSLKGLRQQMKKEGKLV